MKKIIMIGCMLIGMSVGAFAQNLRIWASFHEATKNRQSVVSRAIDETVQDFFAPRAEWVSTVHRVHNQVALRPGLLAGPVLLDPIFHQTPVTVPAQQRKAVTTAMQTWKRALAQNEPLKKFKVVVLRSQDIAELTQADVDRVAHVLTGALDVHPGVKKYQHYIVGVTVPTKKDVHLLFNCVAEELYIMHGNTPLPNIPLEETVSGLR